jgi:hypothetical protein
MPRLLRYCLIVLALVALAFTIWNGFSRDPQAAEEGVAPQAVVPDGPTESGKLAAISDTAGERVETAAGSEAQKSEVPNAVDAGDTRSESADTKFAKLTARFVDSLGNPLPACSCSTLGARTCRRRAMPQAESPSTFLSSGPSRAGLAGLTRAGRATRRKRWPSCSRRTPRRRWVTSCSSPESMSTVGPSTTPAPASWRSSGRTWRMSTRPTRSGACRPSSAISDPGPPRAPTPTATSSSRDFPLASGACGQRGRRLTWLGARGSRSSRARTCATWCSPCRAREATSSLRVSCAFRTANLLLARLSPAVPATRKGKAGWIPGLGRTVASSS